MDYNADGKTDLIAGDSEGQVWLFLNVGTKAEPVLAEGVRVEAAGKPIVGTKRTYKQVDGRYVVDEVIPGNHQLSDIYSKLHMADWNADGLPDLLIGHNGTMVWYRNVGELTAPEFTDPESVALEDGSFPSRPSPFVIDWDADGLVDLLVGSEAGPIHFFRNVGTAAEPVLAAGEPLALVGADGDGHSRVRFDVADWNGDGILDIIAGDFYVDRSGDDYRMGGNVWLYLGQ